MTALDGSFGIGVQSAYDTAVTPTRWYPVQSVDLQPEFINTEDEALMGGGFGRRASARTRVGYGATGSVEMEVLNKKMALLLEHITGTVVAGSAVGSGYSYVMPFTRNTGLYLTCQEGLPDDDDTEQPYTMVGGKVTAATFAASKDEKLTVALDLDGREVVDTEALAAPSFTAGLQPFNWAQCSVKIGAFGSEVIVDGIEGMSVSFDRPVKTDTRYAGSAGRKSQPRMNGRPTVSGTISTDFLDKADFLDVFMAGDNFSLIWEFIGATGTGYSETFRIALPWVELDGALPSLDGEDYVSVELPFTALRDDTAGRAIATVTYITADSAA